VVIGVSGTGIVQISVSWAGRYGPSGVTPHSVALREFYKTRSPIRLYGGLSLHRDYMGIFFLDCPGCRSVLLVDNDAFVMIRLYGAGMVI
jgi:hypothetical protein